MAQLEDAGAGDAGHQQALRRCAGPHRCGLRGLRRRSGRPGGRQRRGQIDPDQVYRRHQPDRRGRDHFEGRRVSIHSPKDSLALGISTVYQDLALCDNLDVVANLYLGREEIQDYRPWCTQRLSMKRRWRSAPLRAARPVGLDPQRAHADRFALRRAAPVGGGGPLGDVEPKLVSSTSRPPRWAWRRPARCST